MMFSLSKIKVLFLVLVITIAMASPFVYDPALFTGDAVYSKELWLMLVIPLCILFLVIKRTLRVSLSVLDLLVVAFWGYSIIYGLFSFEDLENNNYLFILSVSVFFYFLFKTLVAESVSTGLILIWVIVCSGFILSLIGVLQFFNIIHRSFNTNFKLSGFFVNPALYACYLMACTIIPIYIIKNEKKCSRSVWPGLKLLVSGSYLTVLLASFSIPASGSRAALVGLTVGCLFLFRNSILQLTKWKLTLIVIGIGFAVMLYYLFHLRPDSANGRFLIWKVSSNIISKHPFLGVGPGAFKSVYGIEQGYYLNESANRYYSMVADNTEYAFNEFVQMWCELGVVGLFLFGLVLYFALKPGNNLKENENKSFNGGIREIAEPFKAIIISIITFSFFSYPFQSISISVFFYASLGIISVGKPSILSYSLFFNTAGKIVFVLFGFVVSYYSIFCFNRKSSALKDWQMAKMYDFTKDSSALVYYQRAFPTLNSNGVFLAEYGKALLIGNSIVEAQKVLNRASKIRNDYFVFLNLGEAYIKGGQDSLGLKYYRFAKDMVPNRFFPLFKIMEYYEQKEDMMNAKIIATEILKKDIKVESPAVSDILDKAKKLLKK